MEDDQQFCLRWNNHQSTLIAVFDTLLENGTLVDCTLAAEGKYLNAHKVVLSACSPYFESLLSQNYDKHPIFILKDVKFQELKAMMDYMYRGEVNISQDQLSALLRAAESLQIKGLSDNRSKSSGGAGSSAASDTGDHPTPAKKQAVMQQSKQQQLPNKGQGLTITEPRRMNKTEQQQQQQQQIPSDDREGSVSPGPSRRRKRARRKSTDTEDHLNHHDGASNSSESHQSGSTSAMMTATTTMTSASNKTGTDVPAPIDTKADILAQAAAAQARTNEQPASSSSNTVVPNLILKEKQEPAGTSATSASSAASNIISHAEVMLEPKSEYIDDMNEDSIEDLTLDDDDLSNMEGQMEDGAGPSQGHGHGESSQDPFIGLLQPTVTSTSAPSFAHNIVTIRQPSTTKHRVLLRLIKPKPEEHNIKLTSSTRVIRKPKRYITETEQLSPNRSDSDANEHEQQIDLATLLTQSIDPLADTVPTPLIPILNTFAVDSNTVQGAQYDVDMLMYGLGGSMRKYAPETVRWALDAILNRGASVTAASQASGIKRTSLHLYLKKLNIRKVRYESGETLVNANVGENVSGSLFEGETSGGLIIEELKGERLDLLHSQHNQGGFNR